MYLNLGRPFAHAQAYDICVYSDASCTFLLKVCVCLVQCPLAPVRVHPPRPVTSPLSAASAPHPSTETSLLKVTAAPSRGSFLI